MVKELLHAVCWLYGALKERLGQPYHVVLGAGLAIEIIRRVRELLDATHKKRYLLVDTQSLLMQRVVHAADIQDRDGGVLLMASLFGRLRPQDVPLIMLRSSGAPRAPNSLFCQSAGSSSGRLAGSTAADDWPGSGSALWKSCQCPRLAAWRSLRGA